MQGSLKLGRVAGIETRVHYTWLFSSPHTVIVGEVSSITRGAPALSINDSYWHTLRRRDCAWWSQLGSYWDHQHRRRQHLAQDAWNTISLGEVLARKLLQTLAPETDPSAALELLVDNGVHRVDAARHRSRR
jgi:hypothetical protein